MSGAFDMGEAVRPSALIRTARWSLLVVGIWYGARRYNQLKIQEDEIRAYKARMKPIWDAEKAETAAKVNRENMLKLAKEVGVKIELKEHAQIHTDIMKEAKTRQEIINENCPLCRTK